MNNIDAILEWIENLQFQIEERIIDGVIDIKGEERMMTEEEKNKLKDKKESLNYVYKTFGLSLIDSLDFDLKTGFHVPTKNKSDYNNIIEEMRLAPSFAKAMSLFEELCVSVGI